MLKRIKNLWEWSKFSPNWVTVPKDAVEAPFLESLTNTLQKKAGEDLAEIIYPNRQKEAEQTKPDLTIDEIIEASNG